MSMIENEDNLKMSTIENEDNFKMSTIKNENNLKMMMILNEDNTKMKTASNWGWFKNENQSKTSLKIKLKRSAQTMSTFWTDKDYGPTQHMNLDTNKIKIDKY